MTPVALLSAQRFVLRPVPRATWVATFSFSLVRGHRSPDTSLGRELCRHTAERPAESEAYRGQMTRHVKAPRPARQRPQKQPAPPSPNEAPDGRPRTRLSRNASLTLNALFNKDTDAVDFQSLRQLLAELGFRYLSDGNESRHTFERTAGCRWHDPEEMGTLRFTLRSKGRKLSLGHVLAWTAAADGQCWRLDFIRQWYDIVTH